LCKTVQMLRTGTPDHDWSARHRQESSDWSSRNQSSSQVPKWSNNHNNFTPEDPRLPISILVSSYTLLICTTSAKIYFIIHLINMDMIINI